MSSEYDSIVLLSSITKNLYAYGGPVLMILGATSSLLGLCVFGKKNLRKNPCSIYFIAVNVNNLLLIYTSILFSTLAFGYLIDSSAYNLIFCRFRFYAMHLFDVLTPCYLILASIDRVLCTSHNHLTRQKSTCYLAYKCIIIVTIFWIIGHTHTLIFTNIISFGPGVSACYFQPGTHIEVLSYYALIKAIVIPLLMLSLGFWTVKNVRATVRVTPAGLTTNTLITQTRNLPRTQSKDRQLIQILLIDTSIYIIFNIMIAMVLTYQEFTKNQSKTSIQSRRESLLLSIGVFSSYIPFCITCFTNLLVSKTFRQGVKNVLMCKH